MKRPESSEYADFYAGYVAKVPEHEVLPVLEAQPDDIRRMAAGVAPERETWRYEPEKWSIREMVGHLSDAERVFGYRAWRISRGDQTPLPGFEQNPYIEQSGYHQAPLAELVDELLHLRAANLAFLRRLDDDQWSRVGTAADTRISVRALAFIMAGHIRHHLDVLAERYGVG